MTKKKRYYPNKVARLRAVPAEYFEPCDYDDFMTWKLEGWQIPNEVLCIIREHDPKSGKVREFTYKREHAAKKKTREIMDAGNHFVLCTANSLQHIKPTEDWADDDYDDTEDYG